MTNAATPFVADSPHVVDIIPSPNINARRNGLRPEVLVMHYTGLPSFRQSIDVLRDPRCQVSCHYVVDVDGRIVQMVPEENRAWHAGVSSWHGERDLNSQSIGIEIQNAGHDAGYPDFPDAQMTSVHALASDIIARHGIRARNVVAHSDIAPGRKIDPGEKFDWKWLHEGGVGHWVAPAPVSTDRQSEGQNPSDVEVARVQENLREYGYGVEVNGVIDACTTTVVTAFQRHFRPQRIDGRIDNSTADTLELLLRTVG